jgi:hypothetical protein
MGETHALLLTDIVDSTTLSEQLGDVAMAALWARHDALARDLLPLHRGREIDKSDGFLLLFDTATDAVAYSLAYHHALASLDPPVHARAGLHVGEVILTENAPEVVARGAKPIEVDGLAKPTAARVMSVAVGGQTPHRRRAQLAGPTTLRLVARALADERHRRADGAVRGGDADAVHAAAGRCEGYRVVSQDDLWPPVKRSSIRSPPSATRSSAARRTCKRWRVDSSKGRSWCRCWAWAGAARRAS